VIDPQSLAADARALPPLSSAVQEVLRLMRGVNTSAEALETAILRDAALTANLLRIANSPVFGLRRQVRSPSHAVTLLGHARVRDLVVTASLQATLPAELPGYRITASGFLSHSIAVAYLSERIGQQCLPGREAPWFVAGLLHDIGKLILSRHLAERQQDLASQLEQRATLVAAEQTLFGTDHTEVAEVIGNSWHLPPDIIGAATGHHDPNGHAKGSHAFLVDVVHVANVTAHAIGYGADVAGLARSVDPQAFTRLELRASIIERIASDALDALVEACRIVTPEDNSQ
jgi:putative nucleotidyltransferase with HDIG domain